MIIYLITNRVNGKRYVGQTVNTLKHRWNLHVGHSRNPKRSGVLCSAIRKYGPENFEMKVLAKCDSMEEMNHRETYYINKIFKTLSPNGYNLDSGGKNKIMHPDTKIKLSAAKKGKKIGPFSEEHKRRISEANKGKNLGGTLSEETCRKISEAHKGEKSFMFGKKQTEKNKKAVSKANKNNKYWVGKKHSEESKNKISESRMGKFLGSANPFFGKTHSAESLDKMSKANDKTKIKVLCVNTGIQYDSKNAASKALNVDRHQISKVISGELPHVKGLIFKKV